MMQAWQVIVEFDYVCRLTVTDYPHTFSENQFLKFSAKHQTPNLPTENVKISFSDEMKISFSD